MLSFFYTNFLEYYVPRVEGGKVIMPIYLPEDFRAPFVDPLTATGPAVLEILSDTARYNGQTLPLVGDVITPREMVETFQRVTGIEAEYRNAYSREGRRPLRHSRRARRCGRGRRICRPRGEAGRDAPAGAATSC